MTMPDEWIRGARYKVTYIPPMARKPRTMVAVYLGWNGSSQEHEFSGRPVFGTTQLRETLIEGAERVPQDTECYANRMVK